MQLTDKQLQEFIDIWEKEFGERLTIDKGRSEAQRLIDFVLALKEIFPKKGN